MVHWPVEQGDTPLYLLLPLRGEADFIMALERGDTPLYLLLPLRS
jgi:hypothetical protein